MSIDPSLNALTSDGLEICRLQQGHAPILSAADDGCGQWVFAGAFETGGQAQHRILTKSCLCMHRDQLWLAFG